MNFSHTPDLTITQMRSTPIFSCCNDFFFAFLESGLQLQTRSVGLIGDQGTLFILFADVISLVTILPFLGIPVGNVLKDVSSIFYSLRTDDWVICFLVHAINYSVESNKNQSFFIVSLLFSKLYKPNTL